MCDLVNQPELCIYIKEELGQFMMLKFQSIIVMMHRRHYVKIFIKCSLKNSYIFIANNPREKGRAYMSYALASV